MRMSIGTTNTKINFNVDGSEGGMNVDYKKKKRDKDAL